jgi:cytochrome c biogenesis protein CcmG, thiol:disulfide interchange protein DsbE
MVDFKNFYRLSKQVVYLALGILILIFLTACNGAQARSIEFQGASPQAVGGSERFPTQTSQPSAQLTQPPELAEQPQPVAPAQQINPSDAEVGSAASELGQATATTALAVPAGSVVPDSTTASAPSALAASDPAPQQADIQVVVKPEVGFQAPDFTLQTLDSQTIHLSDLKGHPVFITYWSTWCVPCKTELPILQRIRQELAQSDIQMLTINAIEQDKLEAVQGLVGEMGLTMPVLLDHQNQFQSAYNQLFFPTSYFIDSNGVIRFIKLGDASEADIRTNIEKLLHNQL